MGNLIRTCISADERPLSNPFFRIAIFNLHALIIASVLALAGCATPDRAPDPTPPAQISDSTWWQVDRDIGAASLAATTPARNYASGLMASWRSRISQRSEADFIPWFTGYWTQQWLAIKIAWYKLGGADGPDPAVNRLATYLQEQYRDRVLAPVAREIDPNVVREQATRLYIKLLGEQLHAIQQRYDLPPGQFARRLKDIPAIALAPPPANSASLHQIVHTEPLADLPAYLALIAHIRKAAGSEGAGPSTARISPVAQRASEKLIARLAASGGAGAAAAAVGGVAGMVISLSAASFGAIAHEAERPAMEAQLRESLNAALDDMWGGLMEDPATSVMAGVHHIAVQIEGGLTQALALPIEFELLPREVPLSDNVLLQDEDSDEETPSDETDAEE